MGMKLIIAGGGIGGMATALALHRAGIEFKLFEQAATFAEAGAGMSLWPNATRVLRSLGVLESVAARGEEVTHFNLQRPDGNMLAQLPMAGFATPALCLHRADLHRALRDALPASCLETEQTLQSFVETAGGVVAQLASGRRIEADGLVGADGIRSAVRAQLHGGKDFTYRGYCIWRGIAQEIPGGIRGHISETWGAGRRFGILPMGRGRVCWYATRNSPARQGDGPEGRKAEVLGLFADWHRPIAALIAATPPADIIKHDARDRPPLPHWGTGRVTLLGDAAHPLTPNVGQGACLAIEDAAALAKCLSVSGDVATAFRAYANMRRPRVARIARQSRHIGMIGQWENRWLVQARNFVTRLVLSHSAEMPLNSVYAYEV